MLLALTVVMVSRMSIYLQAHQDVHIKWVQLFVRQSDFNKVFF